MGRSSAATTSVPRNARNTGLSSLPIQVMILLGFREKSSTAAKNTAEKIASATCSLASPMSLPAPTLKLVLAQRGMAKRGPMVR